VKLEHDVVALGSGVGDERARDGVGVDGEDGDLDHVSARERQVGREAGVEVGVVERDESP
jgi:hypothetical protein